MNIRIRGTAEEKTLNIIDSSTGVNYVQDLIGNTGALHDGRFVWDEETSAYWTTQEEYDWWAQFISDTEQTEQEAEALANELDMDVKDVMMHIQEHQESIDYEYYRSAAITAMQDLREQQEQ